MRKLAVTALVLLLLPAFRSAAQEISWERIAMDGSRTGVTAPSADNVRESLGYMDGDRYYAPNGTVYKKGSATYEMAAIMFGAQERMAEVKTVIGHSAKEMKSHAPESELSNWFIDVLMSSCGEMFGRKIDVGITNFGGIRADMPEGEVLLDDIMSMFPFKNTLCYVALQGRDLRRIFEQMAATRFQVLGGVEIVAEGGRLVSVKVGGKPLDDNRIYGIATISFVLDGGDGLFIARNAKELLDNGVYIMDAVISYVQDLEVRGELIDGHIDGRIKERR